MGKIRPPRHRQHLTTLLRGKPDVPKEAPRQQPLRARTGDFGLLHILLESSQILKPDSFVGALIDLLARQKFNPKSHSLTGPKLEPGPKTVLGRVAGGRAGWEGKDPSLTAPEPVAFPLPFLADLGEGLGYTAKTKVEKHLCVTYHAAVESPYDDHSLVFLTAITSPPVCLSSQSWVSISFSLFDATQLTRFPLLPESPRRQRRDNGV